MKKANGRNGARPREPKSKSNGNGNGNGNGYNKYGVCSKCKKETILTEHHIWKRSVWGPNDYTVFLCRDCHDELERKVRIMENMILRLFMFCYDALYYDFMNGKELNDDHIMKICIDGLEEMIEKSVAEPIELKEGWAVERMQNKISLKKIEE
jgi:hypothetical protein